MDDWGSTWDEVEDVPEQQESEQGIAENHEAAHSNQQEAAEPVPPPPPPNVNVEVIESKPETVKVDGDDANEALENARKAGGGFLGEVSWKTNINGAPSVSYSYTEEGGTYTVTAGIKDINITITTTMTLPEWSGYSSASPEQQKIWNEAISGLKAHEDGHVEIAKAEAAKMKQAIMDVRPESSSVTFVTKSGDKDAMYSKAKTLLNAPKISGAITTGFANHNKRQGNYDNVSGHTLSPQQLKDKGIDY